MARRRPPAKKAARPIKKARRSTTTARRPATKTAKNRSAPKQPSARTIARRRAKAKQRRRDIARSTAQLVVLVIGGATVGGLLILAAFPGSTDPIPASVVVAVALAGVVVTLLLVRTLSPDTKR